MPVFGFDPRSVNYLEADGNRYFLLSQDGRAPLLVRDECPHRGGPLHLGRLDAAAEAIHCPWHCQRIPLRHLHRNALPLIVRRDSAVVVLPGSEEVPVRAQQRVLLARCAGTPAEPPASEHHTTAS
ncbi:Rieske 2Fe-2S domain-containing protein [Corallococcus terminator]